MTKPNPNCKKCDGEGYFEKQIAVDDTEFRACECTRPDDEEGLDDYMLEHRND